MALFSFVGLEITELLNVKGRKIRLIKASGDINRDGKARVTALDFNRIIELLG